MRHLEQMKDMKENNRITSEDNKATKLEKQGRILRNMINLRLDLLNEDWPTTAPGNLMVELGKKYRVTGGSQQCRHILRRMAHKPLHNRPTAWRESAIERIKETGKLRLMGGSHGPAVTVPLKVDDNNKVSVNTAKFGLLELK